MVKKYHWNVLTKNAIWKWTFGVKSSSCYFLWSISNQICSPLFIYEAFYKETTLAEASALPPFNYMRHSFYKTMHCMSVWFNCTSFQQIPHAVEYVPLLSTCIHSVFCYSLFMLIWITKSVEIWHCGDYLENSLALTKVNRGYHLHCFNYSTMMLM